MDGIQIAAGVVLLLNLAACSRPSVEGPTLLPTRAVSGAPQVMITPAAELTRANNSSQHCDSTVLSSGTSANTDLSTGKTGQVVYVNRDGNIALLDPTSNASSLVTTDASVRPVGGIQRTYKYPTFSNDARALLFVSLEVDQDAPAMTSTVIVAEAVERPRLSSVYSTDENIPYVDWSPDDSLVAALTINPTRGEVQVIPRTGGVSRVFGAGASAYWNWRRDSKAMVAHLDGSMSNNPGSYLSLGDARANTGDRLALMPGNFQSPQFSPDGKTILVVKSNAAAGQLILADATGSQLCELASLQSGAFFAWSPDGRKIAYMDTTSPMFAAAPIEVIDLPTGKTTELTGEFAAFFWSPDSTMLAAYSIDQGDHFLDFDSGKAVSRATPSEVGKIALLHLDVIDVASTFRTTIADTIPTRDFVQLLGFFDQYSRALTPWSPDSTRLAFSSMAPLRATSDIVVATLPTGRAPATLARVADGTLAFWSPR